MHFAVATGIGAIRSLTTQSNVCRRDWPPQVWSEANMNGYWEDPQKTAAVIRDGWLHTGDLGKRDADGWYYFVGRS